jgi:putative ABC transport system substrate-binding protein
MHAAGPARPTGPGCALLTFPPLCRLGDPMRRRDFITFLSGAALAWSGGAVAQPADRMPRIGVLMANAETDPEGQLRVSTFREGLHDLGWVEGRTVRIDYRWAADDVERARIYAAELVDLKPDVILASSTPSLVAVKGATEIIPIVFVQVSDPAGLGFVASLARPGGNATGFTNFEPAMGGKWLGLLKEISPQLARVALIFNPVTAPGAGSYYLRALEVVAPSFGVELVAAKVHDAAEVEAAVASFAREANGGLIAMPDTFTVVHRDVIIAQAGHYRLPAIYPFRYFAVDGGLISYGSDTADLYRRAPAYVDRILKGATPAELPVQAPTKFELVINLKTANTLGLTIPPTLLARADEVIE